MGRECLKRNIDAEYSSRDPGQFPARLPESFIAGLLPRCVPEFAMMPSYERQTFEAMAESFNTSGQTAALAPFAAMKQREADARKAADKAELARSEPPLLRAYGLCVRAHAARLAVATGEPAPDIVQASFAACIPQKVELIELHRRLGDPGFAEAWPYVEQNLAPRLTLDILNARARPVAPAPLNPPPTRQLDT